MPETNHLPFPIFDEPVTVQLPKLVDGRYVPESTEFPLHFRLATLQRLSKRLGIPMIGRRGSLLDVDEAVLPILIYEGVCDPRTGEPPKRASGEPVTLEEITELPASALVYLIDRFTTAYNQAMPVEKKRPAIPETTDPKPN